jgi:hypothetical protein
MAVKYSNWPQTLLPFSIPRPTKIFPNWDSGIKINHLATLTKNCDKEMAVKYSKWPQTIPTFSIQRPTKIFPNWDFGIKMKPNHLATLTKDCLQMRKNDDETKCGKI